MVLRACRLGVAAAFDRVSQRQIPFNVSRPRSLAGRESSQQTRGSQRIRNMRGAPTRGLRCGNDRETDGSYEKCATRERAAERRKSPPRIRRYPQWIARLSRGRRANYFACSGGVPAGALHSLRAAAPPSIAQELARLARDTRTRRRSPRGLAHASVSTRRASTGSKKKELLVF